MGGDLRFPSFFPRGFSSAPPLGIIPSVPVDIPVPALEFPFAGPMADLGGGVLSAPDLQEGESADGPAEFVEGAEDYAARYSSDAYWEHSIRLAFSCCAPGFRPETVLDVGCGAGNTVFPLLGMSADVRVVAGDMSVPLLRILRRRLDGAGLADRCAAVRMDAQRFPLRDASCDLVCGSAILHHLYRPQDCLMETGRVLKPGGYAMFFEPFEMGYRVLSLVMAQLLARDEAERLKPDGNPLSRRTAEFLVRRLQGYDRAMEPDKSAFSLLEDKWLLSAGMLRTEGARAGLELVSVQPMHSTEALFSAHLDNLLRLGLDLSLDALPGWAMRCVLAADTHFSPAARREIVLEGMAVFRKA